MALEQGDLLAQAVHQQGAVGQVGQWVVVRQVADLCLGVLQLADVASGQQQARRFVEGQGFDRNLDGQNFPALVAGEHFAVVGAAIFLQVMQQNGTLLFVGPDTDVENGAPDHFIGAVAAEPAEAIVDFQVATRFTVGDGDGVGAGVEGLGELLLAGHEGGLGALLGGDVAQGGDTARLVLDVDQAAGNHAGQDMAIVVVHRDSEMIQGFIAKALFEPFQAFFGASPKTQLFGSVADHLAGTPTEGLGEGRVDLDELAAFLTNHADRVGAGLEQAGEFFFGVDQALFSFDLVGDVEQRAGHAQWVALLVAIEAGTAFDVARIAIFQLYAVGDLVIAGRPFAQAAIGLAHAAAFFLRYAFEEGIERLVKGDGRQAVELGGTCRPVEHAAGDVPVPGAQLRRIQGQVQALLAVLERLFGAFAFAGVDKGAE
ncbi:hypothetical protein D9M71_282960 [compost metagenome]